MTHHLDDEALSSAVDGAPTPEQRDHLASCPDCRAAMESFSAVSRAVGGPVPPRSASDVDDAIAAAMTGWSEQPAPPVEDPHSARRPPRWLVPAMSVAAALIIVAGVVALARGSSKHTTTSAADRAPTVATTGPTASTGPTSASAPALPPSGVTTDLGSQSDPAALARLVLATLAHDNAASAASGSDQATTASPSAASPSPRPPGAACLTQAEAALRVSATPPPDLRFSASLRWQDRPAVVLVFSKGTGLVGAVMSDADCSVLAELPF